MARQDRSSADQAGERVQSSVDRVYAHTLTVRLTAEQYRRLRRFVTGYEDRSRRRITHQAVFETALHDYLEKQQNR